MNGVKHSSIVLNRNDFNNIELVFSGYDKICRDKESYGIASLISFLLFRFFLPRRDAEDYAVIFVSIRLMKPLPFQNAQVGTQKGIIRPRFLYNGGFYSPLIGLFLKKITMMMMK
ncbi:hypothetical protein CEXT_544311 [Caerostris extrusa]|uniref:Uncharacterized protein n=1 Tax=Caerostris extrusa TaxID=172846 RepID=A0AAV4QDU3_CAEEX|nr:hypothetical protein CEXT_544311 [Caerostris extrusa]